MNVSKSKKKLLLARETDQVIAADKEGAERVEITKVETKKMAENTIFHVFSELSRKPSSPLSPRSPDLSVPEDRRPRSGSMRVHSSKDAPEVQSAASAIGEILLVEDDDSAKNR
jgi:hypothetical protein